MSKPTDAKRKAKPTDAGQVAEWMERVDTSVKPGIELLREIIKGADPDIAERIKWNAPSYSLGADIVTFGPRRGSKVLLVFHHPHVVNIKSNILEGDYKDRRLAWFSDISEIESNRAELVKVLREIIASIPR